MKDKIDTKFCKRNSKHQFVEIFNKHFIEDYINPIPCNYNVKTITAKSQTNFPFHIQVTAKDGIKRYRVGSGRSPRRSETFRAGDLCSSAAWRACRSGRRLEQPLKRSYEKTFKKTRNSVGTCSRIFAVKSRDSQLLRTSCNPQTFLASVADFDGVP